MSTNLAAANPAQKPTLSETISRIAQAHTDAYQKKADAAKLRIDFLQGKVAIIEKIAPDLARLLAKHGIEMQGVQAAYLTGIGDEPITEKTTLRVEISSSTKKGFNTENGARNFTEKVEAELRQIASGASVNHYSFDATHKGVAHDALITIWL